MYENLLPRFLRYVKTEIHSDAASTTTSSTQTQVAFAQTLKKESEKLGMSDVIYNEANGFVTAALPSNMEKDVRSIGLIARMDTADFNAVNISPQIVEGCDGGSTIPSDKEDKFTLNTKDFPNLRNYRGETLITADGTTLLGAGDKSGIAEIMTAMEYLIDHPEIKHGIIRVVFGPDEEVGIGTGRSGITQFNMDFAYTMNGEPVDELQFEAFNAAQAEITIQGKSVHPGTAKNTMTNALQLGIGFHNALPADEVPEKAAGEEGFYHLTAFAGTPEEATMAYIIRDHNREIFEVRKAKIKEIQQTLNAPFNEERIKVDLSDRYYNMREVIKKDMSIVRIVKQAMEELSIQPITEPVRGRTNGLEISCLGIPTPDIFAGGENMHSRFESISLQTMEEATNMIIKIVELNTK